MHSPDRACIGPVSNRGTGARGVSRVCIALGIAGLALACRTPSRADPLGPDWLVDPTPYRARVEASGTELVLTNGLALRRFRLTPALACIALDQLTSGLSLLRAVEPEAVLVLDGARHPLGGLTGQVNRAFLTESVLAELVPEPGAWRCTGVTSGPIESRFAWARRRVSEGRPWPPPGRHLVLEFAPPPETSIPQGLRARVHHELYDGLPLFAKWIELENGGERAVTLTRFESERLAVVEPGSAVERVERWPESALHVFSDYSMGGGERAVRWETDPSFGTQVNYRLETPCLVVSSPPLGPAEVLAPGERFVSHRTFELLRDSSERERNGLALRRALRTLAPWSTENPLILHARSAAPADVRIAVDQAAEVGFELVLLSFGSGFDFERTDPAYVEEIRALTDYAHGRGVELGGYTLLASRRISDEHDVIDPETGQTGHAIFGDSPCLESRWGQEYFTRIRAFAEATGLDAIEHDGNYPGDVCASRSHPGHVGLEDSQWRQWRRITDFYAWARGRGVYLNVPDLYLLNGANKSAMGYRETNWSLPREEQLLHARMNIFDGTWDKAPSMGWMFVPLVEYQGGGAAATIEPLSEHLDTYEAFLQINLGAGVQACWRGPRLYDSPETRARVRRWVDWFKERRAILESDVIHLRRADGRDWDGLLHVNPALPIRGLGVLYNPLRSPLPRRIVLPLAYTGLEQEARVRIGTGPERARPLGPDRKLVLDLELPPGMTWVELR
jgi:hypothetical protein